MEASVKKYRDLLDMENAIKDNLDKYIKAKIYLYKQCNLKNSYL